MEILERHQMELIIRNNDFTDKEPFLVYRGNLHVQLCMPLLTPPTSGMGLFLTWQHQSWGISFQLESKWTNWPNWNSSSIVVEFKMHMIWDSRRGMRGSGRPLSAPYSCPWPSRNNAPPFRRPSTPRTTISSWTCAQWFKNLKNYERTAKHARRDLYRETGRKASKLTLLMIRE